MKPLETLLQNLRYAVRQLIRNPIFSVVAVVTLALGMGGTTVIFGLANTLLLRPLPVHEPERLIGFAEVGEEGSSRSAFSYPQIQAYRAASGEVARVAAHGFAELALNLEGDATVGAGSFVTADYFQVLGLAPVEGRFFAPDEEVPGDPRAVAVLSHDLWQQGYGGDPDAIGGTVRVNGQALTVIGVAPRGFRGLTTGLPADLWLPIPLYSTLIPGSDIDHPTRQNWLDPVARLAPGVSKVQAETGLSQAGRSIDSELQERGVQRVEVSELSGIPLAGRTSLQRFMGLLLACAALVLLIACVNVAGMLMARATARRRELAIRRTLGAGRGRLLLQLLTESTLLFLLGGVGAVLLASWLSGLLVALQPAVPFPVSLDVSMDASVVGFAMALALATGLLFGLAPALQASGADVLSSLKSGGAGAGGGGSRVRNIFVTAQLALTVLLLVTAGLLTRSLQNALEVDPGIDAENVIVAGLNLDPHGYEAGEGRLLLVRLTDRLETHPQIERVGFSWLVPLGLARWVSSVEIPGVEPPEGRTGFPIDFNVVDAGYFEAVRVPMVKGRAFGEEDRPGGPGVAIINETMARRFWPQGDALGSTLRAGGGERTIVGIARDGKYRSLDEAPLPFLYLPHSQAYRGAVVLHVRSDASLGPVEALLRRELRALDPDVPLTHPALLRDRITVTLLPQRMGAMVIGSFGGVGLLLALVGLYGILAYGVNRRTREIGVRMALGASEGRILALVVRKGLALTLVGLGVGLLLSLGVTRLLGGLMVEVSPTDPLTFLLVALVLGATGFFASYLPARRAAKLDPMVTLRAD